MPLCNMRLVDSQYSVIWKRGWLVFVGVLAVLWCRRLVCHKYRIKELECRSQEVVGIGSAGNVIQKANSQMEVVRTAVV